MTDHILNLLNQFLCYADATVTDNPHMRQFDFRRRVEGLAVKNPYSNVRSLAPGQSFSIFDGSIATALSGASTMSLSLLSAADSVYRLSVTSGPAGFRTARSPTGIVNCTVTINNNAIAEFTFTGATLSGVLVGDILRVKGQTLYDSGPYAFNPLNGGVWKIIGIAGAKVSCVRLPGETFQASPETASSVAADVSFYADDKVLPGTKMAIDGSFSFATARTYEVKDATPTTIDFVSAISLPLESAITYVSGSIIFYSNSKKLTYVEVDQDCVIRYNGATDNSNKITPIEAGNPALPGYAHKWGDTFKCEVVNQSINSCNIRFFTAE